MIKYEILTPEDMDLIHAKSLEILENIGVLVESEKVLKMLDENGCDVDFDRMIVKFKPEIVENALEAAPSSFTMGGFTRDCDMEVGVGNSYICTDSQGMFVMKDELGKRRESTMADLVDTAKVVDEMDYIMCHWPLVTANDVPESVRTIREMVEIWRVSSKHVETDCYNEAQAKYYIELLDEIFGREEVLQRSPLSLVCCPVSPLKIEGPMVEGTIALGEINVPVNILVMPIMGMTSPMSLFSAVIQNNTEVLASATIFELANPGRRIIYGACACEMDMQTNQCLVAAVEPLLVGTACMQMAKRYHLPCCVATTATDDHVLGPRSGMERAMNAAACFEVGADLIGGVGLTSSAMNLDLAGLVYDEDTMNAARRLSEGIRTGEENTLTEDIYEQGIGGNFLVTENTLTYLRNGEHFVPRHYKRESYESWVAEGCPDPLKAAEERAQEIIEHHDKDNFGNERYARLQAIIARAEVELAD